MNQHVKDTAPPWTGFDVLLWKRTSWGGGKNESEKYPKAIIMQFAATEDDWCAEWHSLNKTMTSMYNTVCFNIHTLPCVKNAVGKATFTGSKRMDCSSYFQMQAKACQEKTGVKQIMVHLLAWFKKYHKFMAIWQLVCLKFQIFTCN